MRKPAPFAAGTPRSTRICEPSRARSALAGEEYVLRSVRAYLARAG